jgi:acyl carrier protein
MGTDLIEKIRQFLSAELGVREEIAADTSLLASGLVDSAGLVRLAALLERATGRVIPDKDLVAENFDTVDRILLYLGESGGR